MAPKYGPDEKLLDEVDDDNTPLSERQYDGPAVGLSEEMTKIQREVEAELDE